MVMKPCKINNNGTAIYIGTGLAVTVHNPTRVECLNRNSIFY